MSESRFGSDIILSDGDIVATQNGDIFTADDYQAKKANTSKFDGYYNMLFSLLNRLDTTKGDNHFHPEYGTRIQVSDPNDANMVNSLSQAISESLLDDPRVVSVSSVTVKQSGNTITVAVDALLIGATETTQFVFPNFLIG